MQHLLIMLAALIAGAREKRGSDWCRKWGVGYARRHIGVPAQKVVGIVTGFEESEAFKAQVAAAEELRAICGECGRCKMARE